MSNALTRALADTERSYLSAKASVAQVADAMLSQGPVPGSVVQHWDFSRAQEQYAHNRNWVFACVRLIASRIAGQRVCVGRVKRPGRTLRSKAHDDNVEKLDSHPLLDLIADPSDLMVGWSLMFSTVASLQLTGRALWWLPMLSGQRQILPIPVHWIVGIDGKTKFKSFLVRPPHIAGEPTPIPAEEAAYFVLPDPSDPHRALGPLQAAGYPASIDERILRSQFSAFQGIHPSHAVIVGKSPLGDGQFRPRLSGPQSRQIISAIRKRYAGAVKHGEALILDGLIEDVKRLSHSPDEMNWLESSKLTKERICEIFGVNPIVLGQIEGANRASSVVADQHLCQFTLNPLIDLMSQSLTEWLSPQFSGKNQRIVVWIEECSPKDAELQIKRMDMLAKYGALFKNELREWAGLPPADMLEQVLATPTGRMGVDTAVRSVISDELADRWSDNILDQIANPRFTNVEGNGRH